MGIKQMPSASRLRQRFNEDATQLIPLIEEALPELLLELGAPDLSAFKRTGSPSAYPTGYRRYSAR